MCISDTVSVNREVTPSTPCITSHSELSPAEKMARKLFSEGLTHLSDLVIRFPDSVLVEKIENLNKDEFALYEKNSKKWIDLGLNPSWFCRDPEGAQVLLSTRLIYSVLGMQNTEKIEHIRYNETTEEIEILFQGKFASVKRHIQNRFTYSKPDKSIKDTSTKENWFYFGGLGLLPVDKWKTQQPLPVAKLDRKELQRLKEHVQEKDKTVNWNEKSCFIQLVSDRYDLEWNTNTLKGLVTQNYNKNRVIHTWVRLITKNGEVYSIGLTQDGATQRLRKKMPLGTLPKGDIPVMDYRELLPYKIRVTNTFTISEAQGLAVLQAVEEDRRDKKAFDMIVSNCNQLSEKYLKIAGISFPTQEITLRTFFFLMLPGPLKWQNELTTVLHKYTPLPLKKIVYVVWKVAREIIERLVSVLLLNPVLIVGAGWNRNRALLSPKQKLLKQRLHPFSNAFNLKLHCFSQLVKQQLGKELPGNVWVNTYHRPDMCVVPRDRADPYWKKDLNVRKKTEALYQ